MPQCPRGTLGLAHGSVVLLGRGGAAWGDMSVLNSSIFIDSPAINGFSWSGRARLPRGVMALSPYGCAQDLGCYLLEM